MSTVKVEQGNVDSQSDSDWANFAASQAVETGYDAYDRPETQKLISGTTVYALTQTGYDALGRVDCVAQRMDPNDFGSTLPNACTLTSPAGTFGPDRIVKTIYDAAGQATQVKTALGVTGEEANVVTGTYTNNGQMQTVMDAESNKTTYEYDGHDRLAKTFYPSTTKGAGTSSTTDYEQLGYENTASGARTSGTVASFRNRANETIAFAYDALGRLTTKDLPGSEPDVAYAYDLLGRMTSAATSAQTLSFTWDALGRNLTQAGPNGTVSSTYDGAGRRTRLTWPDSFYVDQDYLVTGEMEKIRENGATSGGGVLATFAYDDMGRRTSLTRGNGTVTGYGYDAVSRLSQLTENPGGSSFDLTLGFSYSPAGQIAQNTRSDPGSGPGQADLYAWTGHGSGTTSSTANGLNQIASHGGATLGYDAKGNMTGDPGRSFTYSSENLLTAASANGINGMSLGYDPLMRLSRTGFSERLLYDPGSGAGAERMVAEYNAYTGAPIARYVFGPGVDEPLVWYDLTGGTAVRRFLHADERGSIVLISSDDGNPWQRNRFDEYGKPYNTMGRFQYTGQMWMPELGLHYYKARFYDPNKGRFVQVDPIGYNDQANLYAYVGDDPVNATDPLGRRVRWVFENGGVKQQEKDARAYLARSKTWNREFGRATSMKPLVVIHVDPTAKFNAVRDDNSIVWNPTLGTVTKDGEVQSPSVALGHEINHAHRQARDPQQYETDSQTPTHNGQSNVNEDKATDVSNNIAQELNEPVQKDYTDAVEEMKVPDVTSHSWPK